MSEAITKIEIPKDISPDLLLKVTKMRNRGVSDMEILLYLSEMEGVKPQDVTKAVKVVRELIGESVNGFDAATQCVQGIMTANDIQAEAAKIHDTKGRIAAEKLRLQWTQQLAKLMK